MLSQAGGPPLQTVVLVVPVPNRCTIPCHRHSLARTGLTLLTKIDTDLGAVSWGYTEIDADLVAALSPGAAVRRRQNTSRGSRAVTVHRKQARPSGLEQIRCILS